jgi:diacylglycerol kinase family enzyme
LRPARVFVLLNKLAGAVGQADEISPDALVSIFERHGMTVRLERLAGAELRIGGDGSIRTVATVLAGSGVRLGILPLGTLNHFARDAGIPLVLDHAVTTIAAGHARDVDLGEVNDHIFINNSSIGIYPYFVLDRERIRRKHGLAKWSARFFAAWRTLRYFPLRRLSVHAAGQVEPYRSPCVFVGNNEYRLAVPAFGSRERLDGGELCVYVAKQQSRLSLLWLTVRAFVGFLDPERDLRILKLAAADISSRRHRLLVAFDGEVGIIRSPLCYRTRPGALRVFAPAARQATTPSHFTSTIPT